MKAKLSILIPNYNHAQYLREALDSILQLREYLQEIVICDDASTDSSWEILTEYQKQNSCIRLLRNEKNLGAMNNFLKLLKEAKGKYVMIHAADDFWIAPHMKILLEALAQDCKNLNAMFCGRNVYFNEDTGLKYTIPADFPSGVLPAGSVANYHRRVPWGPAGTIVRTDLYRDLYEKLLPTGCYYDRFLELIVAQKYPIFFLNHETACTRCTATNFSKISKNLKQQGKAFSHFFGMLQRQYQDLYASMRRSNQFADYEGMFLFLLLHPSIWDRHTPGIVIKLIPYCFYRKLRYGILSSMIPVSWKRKYHTLLKKDL